MSHTLSPAARHVRHSVDLLLPFPFLYKSVSLISVTLISTVEIDLVEDLTNMEISGWTAVSGARGGY